MTIYIFDDFCIERVTGRGHNISDLCCKVFVGIHTFYESRTVVESRYIDGQQINSLSGYSEAGIRNIYVDRISTFCCHIDLSQELCVAAVGLFVQC